MIAHLYPPVNQPINLLRMLGFSFSSSTIFASSEGADAEVCGARCPACSPSFASEDASTWSSVADRLQEPALLRTAVEAKA